MIFTLRGRFEDGGVDIILIRPHLHLHGRGIGGELHMAEMVEEEQNPKPDTGGIGDFQNCEAGGRISCYLTVNFGKKISQVNVIIKGHNREGSPEKRGKSHKKDFTPFPYF